jgi:ribosomal protein S27AE
MAKDLTCPNCGAAAVGKQDGSCVCPECGGTFTFQEGEARLAGVGEYDQLKGDVDQLKAGQEELRQLVGPPIPLPADLADDADDIEDVEVEDDEEEDF